MPVVAHCQTDGWQVIPPWSHDFTGCALPRAQLYRADLSGYVLNDADMRYCNLRNARLIFAQCARTDFSHADLRHANLRKIDLSNANLDYGELSDADMSYANLVGANLRHATLARARLYGVTYDSSTVWPIGFDPGRLVTEGSGQSP